MCSWDSTFMGMCDLSAKRSKDPDTKVGATIVSEKNEVRSMGYNGMPRGVDDKGLHEGQSRFDRPHKYFYMEHAERNAIFNFCRQFMEGYTIYVQWCPCADCARAIIQVGIKTVVINNTQIKSTNDMKWLESCVVSLTMFKEAGVVIRTVNSDKNIVTELLNEYGDKWLGNECPF